MERHVGLVVLSVALAVGCSAGGDVGLRSERKVYQPDSGPPPVDSGVPVDAGQPPECTLTPGYWKNHPESWPVMSLVLGDETYTQAELLALLESSAVGDSSLILARHLIAALLNGGASDPAISATIAAAHAWLIANADGDGRLPFGIKSSVATALADTLADYNEGTIGPGHCDD
jgi:hypothetical protein